MKRGKNSHAKKSSAKLALSLPDLDQARSAVLNSLPSKESQRGYRHAIDEFITWYCSTTQRVCRNPDRKVHQVFRSPDPSARDWAAAVRAEKS